jgi:hypothetical protein
MPNHYTTMLICSPGHDFDVGEFNAKHEKTNLCAVVKPMPESVEDIHSGAYRDEFGNTVTAWRESEAADGTKVRTPVAEQSWYDWAAEHWGTKWGTYDVQAFDLGGDSSPVLIKFQSAWCAPKCREEIAEWLKRTYGFERIVFIGFDPYNDSVKMLEVTAEPKE